MGEKVRWENSMQEARGGNGAPATAYLCAARGFRGNRKEQLIVDQTVLRPESGHFPLFPLRPAEQSSTKPVEASGVL